MFYAFYHALTARAAWPLKALLKKRLKKGKEDPERWQEKMGIPSLERPNSAVIWLHAASVGEAQSALILIERILKECPHLHILVTSGTLTSAQMLYKRLPARAIHQYAPLDHPQWINAFLEHWRPDMALWLESELWPNTLLSLKKRHIPAILLNARLSPKSYQTWKTFPKMARRVLSSFELILCQTKQDDAAYKQLGAKHVHVSGNIKYSAAPLPYEESAFTALKQLTNDRPLWLYASTHKGEEEIAARIHRRLKETFPDLLTIIVPRHPDRGKEIETKLEAPDLTLTRRTQTCLLPTQKTDLYISDTLGELGLFYRLSPISFIGRSMSDDGGGGHNPIEAAQLECAVLHGPHIQNLQEIYDEMNAHGAALRLKTEEELYQTLHHLLSNPEQREIAQLAALHFAHSKEHILNHVWTEIAPYLDILEARKL